MPLRHLSFDILSGVFIFIHLVLMNDEGFRRHGPCIPLASLCFPGPADESAMSRTCILLSLGSCLSHTHPSAAHFLIPPEHTHPPASNEEWRDQGVNEAYALVNVLSYCLHTLRALDSGRKTKSLLYPPPSGIGWGTVDGNGTGGH